VARLNATKGHVFTLQALVRLVEKFPDVKLTYTIVGEGPARPEIAAEVARLKLDDHVTFTGLQSEDTVLKRLQGADALALTSFGAGEAAPVSVMEAMACGLPAVVSKIGGTSDMIDDTVDGLLVDQKDVNGIAAAIELLLASPQVSADIGKAARSRAVRDFDYRVNAGKLLNEIRAVVTAKGHS
jgi:glycosyltransferase involved in cell wall biosynthesis